RHQPGIADAEIEPHGRDRQRHHHGSGIVGQTERTHRKRKCDQCEGRQQQRPILGDRRELHSNFSIRSPSSPRGRTRSTTNISTYIDASPAAGAKWMVMPRTTPTRRAAITTPQKLPRPPITTTAKATVMMS